MNFKRKLWWAQHRTDVYKYGTIISLVLIVTISIIYFTYSKFTSTSEATAYETTVEPFIKNDYFIASYIDGEWSNEIPGKEDGYAVDKIVCDNGATATWDNEEWGINIRNATKKIKCSIYFKKLVKFTDQITNLASTDTTNFATDDPDNNIRYIGRDPSNYVYFNCSDYSKQTEDTCEKWRIIGLFNNVQKSNNIQENLIKITRNNLIGTFSFDSSEKEVNNGYGTNDWSNSALMKLLNPGYETEEVGGSLYYNLKAGNCYSGAEKNIKECDFTASGLKNDSTRNAIESVQWNLGASDNVITSSLYKDERSTKVYSGHATTWTGKIGLPYSSDYGYATSGGSKETRESCLSSSLTSSWGSSFDTCSRNNYITFEQFTMTPYLSNNYDEFYILMGRGSNSSFLYHKLRINSENLPNGLTIYGFKGILGVSPTLYLKSDIFVLAGDGSSSNPYQLKLN